jgi:hypothetical protein
MMQQKTPLVRWLQKYIVLKYTFANHASPFQLHYQTVEQRAFSSRNTSANVTVLTRCRTRSTN